MRFIDATKRRLHRDICADPVLHGLVLNLYLNGEEYPHRVEDYFPMAVAEEAGLADAMQRHVRDEDKHIALYRRAIERLGQPVLELPMVDVFNHVVRSNTPVGFMIEARDGRDRRLEKLAHFFAHVHFLEKRIARSLEYHLDGCSGAPCDYPAKVIEVVLRDERRHATYTREAVQSLLPTSRAGEVLSVHEKAEARANLEFSARQLRGLVEHHRLRFPASRRWAYRASTLLLGLARTGQC